MSLQQQSDLYPVSLTDNEWAHILQNSREAQDLLSTAISQHEQYREEDPFKRKGAISQLHSHSDARTESQLSNGETNGENQQYSENDHSSDDGHLPGEGKPAPKKAGRKPLTTEPTNKRKAQNRAAQRAFRDRKERYVKSLEERIKELEELNPSKTDTKLAEENLNLKVLVQKLETENYFLKEQAFTFDFPISQPGLYNVAKANNQSPVNSTSNQSNSSPEYSAPSPASQTAESVSGESSASPAPVRSKPFASSSVAKPPTYDQLPWSPPSSAGDSVPNSPLNSDLSTQEQESVTPTAHSDNAGVVPRFRNSSPEKMAMFSSILDGTGGSALVNGSAKNNLQQPLQNKDAFAAFIAASQFYGQPSAMSVSNASPASTLVGFSDHTPSPTLEDLVNTPLFGSDAHGSVQFPPATSNLSIPPLTFEQTQALFTDFRDPSDPQDIFASFDDPIDSAFPDDTVGSLFNDQLLTYTNAFENVAATPAKEESHDVFGKMVAANHHSLPQLAENEKAMPCPQAWEHIAKHPNFDDADIDDLCAELKSKAKCSGHGPVISLSDVDKLMDKLNQE
ncbi:hypothetical protein EDD21DRAFT_369253 [Dissophora ornata]|nr:hypothetical protein EDD21DRAFT_369253 [Dissophora ornata]